MAGGGRKPTEIPSRTQSVSAFLPATGHNSSFAPPMKSAVDHATPTTIPLHKMESNYVIRCRKLCGRSEMRTQDVLIVTTEVLAGKPMTLLSSQPPFKGQFKLTDDLWAGELDGVTAQGVLRSCEPPGHWVKRPTMFQQLYAFWREPCPTEPRYVWDNDQRLQTCIALSRLIYPTSVSFEYAARVFLKKEGVISEIMPGPVTEFGAQAFIASEDLRNWLTTGDLEALKELLTFTPLNLALRMRRAFWHHEFAARTQDISIRWMLICTALESLVHTDRRYSTKQFKMRVSRIAQEMAACPFSEADADMAYDLRSRLAHGQGLGSLDMKERGIYRRMEEVLRQILLRAIQDQDFAHIFKDDEQIRRRWPVTT